MKRGRKGVQEEEEEEGGNEGERGRTKRERERKVSKDIKIKGTRKVRRGKVKWDKQAGSHPESCKQTCKWLCPMTHSL